MQNQSREEDGLGFIPDISSQGNSLESYDDGLGFVANASPNPTSQLNQIPQPEQYGEDFGEKV